MIFKNIQEIWINTVNGTIHLEDWDEAYTSVSYTIHGEVEVEIHQEGNRLVINEKQRKRFGLFGGRKGWAEFEIKTPRNTVIRAKNVNGELYGRGLRFQEAITVNGEIELDNCEVELLTSVNGTIKARLNVAGPLKASTVNGELELEIEELEGNIHVSTVNGDITLRLTDFCDARITTKKVNGDVELIGISPDEPVIGAGTYNVMVSTVNGDVRVELI